MADKMSNSGNAGTASAPSAGTSANASSVTKPGTPAAPVAHENGETDPERAKLRELLGAGADSQMGLPPNRTTSDVVSTRTPQGIDYGRAATPYNAEEQDRIREREAALGADHPNSATHITDPGLDRSVGVSKGDGGSAHMGADNAARTAPGAAGAGSATTGTAGAGAAGGGTTI